MTQRVDAVLIAGPTASGKSRLAMELAESIGGVVVNADSMQIYRESRILTARPLDADMARVPHLLYGHVSARELYSVGRYQSDATNALAQARVTDRVPIFTGGTGMYFSALTEGLAAIPPIPPAIRECARARLEKIGVVALHAELVSRDLETASRLRPTDPQRVLRAYEVFEATGRPLVRWQKEMGKPVLDGLRLRKFVVDIPRPELRARIEARFKAMLSEGALDEAAMLEGLDPALPAAKILGLRELWALRRGDLTEAEGITLAVTSTRQFAKRQMTWFRGRMKDWTQIEIGDSGRAAAIVSTAIEDTKI
jgi:tRNA dimethylallyltransferase